MLTRWRLTLQFWIRPHNRRGDWSSVLHRSDYSNLPTPGVQFQAGYVPCLLTLSFRSCATCA